MPQPRALSPEQRAAYDCDGLVFLPRAVDPAAARAMATTIWQALERRHGLKPDAPETWRVRTPHGLGPIAKTGAFKGMASPVVTGVLDELLGPDWIRPASWGLPLVTFPDRSAPWDVPHQTWHLDAPAVEGGPAIGRVFLMLSSIAPQGGGTVVVTGSHRLAERIAARGGAAMRSAEVTSRLRADHPWFAELSTKTPGPDRIQRFMHDGAEIDGVQVRVAEMTGEPGDVWFMHPSIIHTASANTHDVPRMMLTQWIDGGRQAATAPAGTGPM